MREPQLTNSDKDPSLPIGAADQPAVPVFSCHVYVERTAGQTRARVANLADLATTAADERTALAELVTAFKRRVSEHLQRGETIPWVDPMEPAGPNEQVRLIPVHL